MKQARSLAAFVLLAALAAPASAQAGGASASPYKPPVLAAAEVQKVQRVLDPHKRRGRGTDDLVRELAGIGAGSAPVLVAILTGDLPGTDWQESGLTLEEVRSATVPDEMLLVEALRRLPPNAVGRALREACAADAPLDRRLVGLHVLAEVGQGKDAVETWLALASGIEEIHLKRAYVRAQVEQGLADCLERSAACFQTLSKDARQWKRKLQPALVQACVQSGRRQAVEVLSGLCGIDRELDLALLQDLPLLAASTVGNLDDLRLAWLRGFVVDPDPLVRAQAANALGRVCDPSGAMMLLDALADEDPRVAQAALWSLRHMSGVTLTSERADWETWLRAEQNWSEEPRTLCLQALEEQEPGLVVEALQQLSLHPLYRHESAAAIANLREREHAEMLVAACATLRQLESLSATEMLTALLQRSEPEVRSAAHQALRALTGRDLPCEPEVWQQALGS